MFTYASTTQTNKLTLASSYVIDQQNQTISVVVELAYFCTAPAPGCS
jgi:hypothetical protein